MTKEISLPPVGRNGVSGRPDSILDQIYHGDCLEQLAQFPPCCVDLVFADPPFNIKYNYDHYKDDLGVNEYVAFSRRWIRACMRVLKPTGSFYIAIGDEHAADIRKIIDEVGGHLRNWIIWHVTFGQAMQKKFSRSHVHIFYFTVSEEGFVFNADAVRVPSARQTTYNDKRANKSGKLPDDTWVLRPQEDPRFFLADQDTWYVPRLCGTFAERQGWHNCQMPESLLERIIKASSNPGDRVLDPFSGSGTTCAAAKKLGRRYLGIELSANYVEGSRARLADQGIDLGEKAALDIPGQEVPARRNHPGEELRAFGYEEDPEAFREAIGDYLFNAFGSWTVDDLLCHPREASRFCDYIRQKFGKEFSDTIILKTLLNLRKRGG